VESKLETVDDLISVLFGIPYYAEDDSQGWVFLSEMFSALVACTTNTLVIDVESDEWTSCPPYIQICVEDDRAFNLEAISNRFLDPPVSLDGLNTLTEMGWELPIDKKTPNFHQLLSGDDAKPQQIASIITKTFRDVYLIKSYINFSIGPVGVIEKMLKTNPQFADYFTKN
jgi:hypothetical protein